MKNQNGILIDKRKKEDIIGQIRKNAVSYTPEWNFNPEDSGDIGAAISHIYAGQIANNITQVNQILDRYHMEFVNLLDMSVKASHPSEAIVVMSTSDTIPGTYVFKGTRLMSDYPNPEEEITEQSFSENIIFETNENVYITSSIIDTIFMVDKEQGTITNIKGDITLPPLLSKNENSNKPEEEADEVYMESAAGELSEQEDTELRSFTLFGERGGLQQNALFIYHSDILKGSKNKIFLRFYKAEELIRDLKKGKKKLVYPVNGELVEVEHVNYISESEICLVKDKEEDLQKLDQGSFSLIGIIDEKPITEDIVVGGLDISALGDKKVPQYVGDGSTDFNPDYFNLFGETLSIYNECYIGCEECFTKKGSIVTIEFDLEYKEKEELLTAREREEELKVIKKKPRVLINEVFAQVYAQQVTIDYFNGIGWKKLPLDRDLSYSFAGDNAGHITVSFHVPDDFAETIVGSYEGRAIRLQLIKSDNCYIKPAIHHYPVIKNMKLSFSYREKYGKPHYLISYYGTKRKDITSLLKKEESFKAFRTTGYDSDALYIGLNKRPEGAPVNIFIELEETRKYLPMDLIVEYSTAFGFRNLKAIDDTNHMTKSGILSFAAPANFAQRKIEGNNKYWIRIRRLVPNSDEKEILPIIKKIVMNGVRVRNIDTRGEEEYYIDLPTPNARFNLGYNTIYDAEVWVNERDILTENQMKAMLEEDNLKIRAEKDIQGNYSAFYVLWQETERLESSEEKRVYELDRLTGELIFGDGVNTFIPRTTSGPAMRVKVLLSDGNRGNVNKYSITTSLTSMPYINNIYNPIKSYGGYNIETVDEAMSRGASIISTRRRLVSMADYINEIRSFSDQIDQVTCIKGVNPAGEKEEGALCFVLLLKDYSHGSYSFHYMEDRLKNHLLNKCEMTVPREKLYICEPVFVKLSVMCWIRANRMQDTYDIKSSIELALEEYFNPLQKEDRGWKIGLLPSESQVQMMIDSFKKDASISNMTIIGQYTDINGTHNLHLSDIRVTPFMICIPGESTIHVQV